MNFVVSEFEVELGAEFVILFVVFEVEVEVVEVYYKSNLDMFA